MKLSSIVCASIVALAALALTTDGAFAKMPYPHQNEATQPAPGTVTPAPGTPGTTDAHRPGDRGVSTDTTTPGTGQQPGSPFTEQQGPPVDGIPMPPQNGDHYLCYDVKKPWNTFVTLRDQFGTYQFHVFAITRLCNPVEKRYKGRATSIRNPALHYVCYRGETNRTNRSVFINNQFGSAMLRVTGPTELCLPSAKRELPHDGPYPRGDQQQYHGDQQQ